MKKYLIAGMITLLPIALTFMVISWLFHFFTGPFLGITQSIVIHFENRTGIDLNTMLNSFFLSVVYWLWFFYSSSLLLLAFLEEGSFLKPLCTTRADSS
jgi:uncharacterized membrane protein